MKKETKNNIIGMVVAIISVSLIFGVGLLVITNVEIVPWDFCEDKIGIQQYDNYTYYDCDVANNMSLDALAGVGRVIS